MHAPADGCNWFPQAFTVILDGFNNQELTKAEEDMAAFKCFDRMRPVTVRASVSEYWYETQTDAARLNHSLRVRPHGPAGPDFDRPIVGVLHS